MGPRICVKNQRHGERGSTIYLVAGFLVILLGMGALAIDLASLYVARNESQRAADSAALAGAKVFVESGCVTSGDCTGEEATATDRATQAAGLNLVGGFPVTIQSISFNETSQNPQITVQLQSANLNTYFAKAIGIATSPTVGATATAEAYNPSGSAGGPTYCTGCVRPWLIANCNPAFLAPGCLLNSASNYSVANPGCFSAGGLVGEPIDVQLVTQPALFAAVDVDNGTGNPGDYQNAITTCFTGQTTCGGRTLTLMQVFPPTESATTMGVENLMHIAAAGPGLGQDTIDPAVCPPQIRAGALNPLVTNGVINPDDVIATSDSIVTAYIFDPATPVTPSATSTVTQSVSIIGFAQIFVTRADPANPGEFFGVLLGVAGCGSNGGGSCGSSAIKGPTMLPVRLIQSGN